jgi:ferredoxin
MILYFSGTGNSRYAAALIARMVGDDLVSMGDYIKKGENPALSSDKPFVFVCPTYAWRIPRVVERFIRGALFSGSRKAYFVLTCGDQTYNAASYARKTCRESGLTFMGLAGIVMPENYIAMFKVPDREEANAIIEKARPRLAETARLIGQGQPLPSEKKTGRFLSGPVNALFYAFVIHPKRFYATDDCVGCGKCADVCTLNNVSLSNGRPRWGDNCTHCMACICLCPVEAIEYGGKSKGKPRYHVPEDMFPQA